MMPESLTWSWHAATAEEEEKVEKLWKDSWGTPWEDTGCFSEIVPPSESECKLRGREANADTGACKALTLARSMLLFLAVPGLIP
jgi:hypothetical protein